MRKSKSGNAFMMILALLFLVFIGLFIWVFRTAFADFFQSFGQKLGIDPKMLAHEYKELFMEECKPFLKKCKRFIAPCRERFFSKKQNEPEEKNSDE